MRLTDEQWQVLQPLFPPSPAATRGRPPVDDRRALEAILLKFASAIPWYNLPADCPPYQTCYRRYHQWKRTGQLNRALSILYTDLHTRGGLDFEQTLRSGEITLSTQETGLSLTCADHLRGTWQLKTALLFLGLTIHKLRHGQL